MRQVRHSVIVAILSFFSAWLLLACGQPATVTNSNRAAQSSNSNAGRQGTQQTKSPYRIDEKTGALVDKDGVQAKDEHGNSIVLLDDQDKAMLDGGTPIIVRGGGSLTIADLSDGFVDATNSGCDPLFLLRHKGVGKRVTEVTITYKLPTGGKKTFTIPSGTNVGILPDIKDGDISIEIDYR
jgi:hypothetical protein